MLKTGLIGVRLAMRKKASSKKARIFKSFFKTGRGQYGEGDRFIGVTVPELRAIAKNFYGLSYLKIAGLLKSPVHEERCLALLILVARYKKSHQEGDARGQKQIYNFYLKHLTWVNNWDLVDGSAGQIMGAYLTNKEKSALYRLAKSQNLWERRVSIVATFPWIRAGRVEDTLKIAEGLLEDSQDLIHKAVGWALREVGKKDRPSLENFLKKNYIKLNRTTLRYALERFSERDRKACLKGSF